MKMQTKTNLFLVSLTSSRTAARLSLAGFIACVTAEILSKPIFVLTWPTFSECKCVCFKVASLGLRCQPDLTRITVPVRVYSLN